MSQGFERRDIIERELGSLYLIRGLAKTDKWRETVNAWVVALEKIDSRDLSESFRIASRENTRSKIPGNRLPGRL